MFAGDLIMHSPRRASMAGSVRDVTAHLLDDAHPDAMSPAQPVQVQQIVPSVAVLPSPAPELLVRPAGTLSDHLFFIIVNNIIARQYSTRYVFALQKLFQKLLACY